MVCPISQTPDVSLRCSSESENVLGGTFSVAYGLRSYNPLLGRWINRDPIGELGGKNEWVFIDNSPCLKTDVNGLYAFVYGSSVTTTQVNVLHPLLWQALNADIDATISSIYSNGMRAIWQLPLSCPIRNDIIKAYYGALNGAFKYSQAIRSTDEIKIEYQPVYINPEGDLVSTIKANTDPLDTITFFDAFFSDPTLLTVVHEIVHTIGDEHNHPDGVDSRPEARSFYMPFDRESMMLDPYLMDIILTNGGTGLGSTVRGVIQGHALLNNGITSDVLDRCCGGREIWTSFF